MCKKGTIDRFEGEWAIVEMENGKFMDIPRDSMPPNAVEGSVIFMDKRGEIHVSTEETQSQRERVIDLMDKLFED